MSTRSFPSKLFYTGGAGRSDDFSLLSPTPPFFLVAPRLRLAGILTVMIVLTPLTSSYWITKMVGFSLGLAFFGGPLFTYAYTYTMDFLLWLFPNWTQPFDIQK